VTDYMESVRQRYAEDRDTFLRALRAMEGVLTVFVEVIHKTDWDSDKSLPEMLTEGGYWITAEEYHHVVSAIGLLERLVGRATLRAEKP